MNDIIKHLTKQQSKQCRFIELNAERIGSENKMFPSNCS
jgi:hypothetical protein